MRMEGRKIKLVRKDLAEEGEDLGGERWPMDRESCIEMFSLPRDSIIKVYYEGHLIPWSLIEKCERIEIRVCRPNQNVKPKPSTKHINGTEELIREKVTHLDSRISSLETQVSPESIQTKTDRDLQLLTKQISFLSRRLDEADHAEWLKKT